MISYSGHTWDIKLKSFRDTIGKLPINYHIRNILQNVKNKLIYNEFATKQF